MIPDNRAFNGGETFEDNGKVFYRSYKIEASGRLRLTINVVSIQSTYRQGLALRLSTKPKFKGKIWLNGTLFVPEKKQLCYVVPVELADTLTVEANIQEGNIRLANASDFLDDYPDLIERISAQTGRSRDQFRGCSYTSGFSAGFLYGNAFWVERLSDTQYRFHCNDHAMDDDFDDLIFDLNIEEMII